MDDNIKNPGLLFHTLMQTAGDGIIIIDDKGTILHFSRSAEQLFGHTVDDCINHNVSMLMPEPDRSSHDAYLKNYQTSGQAKVIGIGRQVTGMRKGGETFPMRLNVSPARIKNRTYYVGLCHDLSDFHAVLVQLTEAEQRYKSIVECPGQVLCRLDSDLRVTYANPSFLRAFPVSESNCPANYFMDYVSADFQHILSEVLANPLSKPIHYKSKIQSQSKPLHFDWWFTKVIKTDGTFEIQVLGIDTTDKEQAISEADFLKKYDPLTRLLNITTFEAMLSGSNQSKRYAIFYTDCNHFGLINQRFGFDIGNMMLIEAADRLQHNISKPALFCRAGSDEFIVAVEIEHESEASNIAKSLLACLSKPYVIAQTEIRVSGKIGVAIYPDNSVSVKNTIRQAESVLSVAKERESGFAFYDHTFHSVLQRRLDVEQRLRVALDDKLLQVHLQSKVDLSDRKTIGYEALLRWHDPVLGKVSPAEFIKVAEDMGIATLVDRYVLRKVCKTIQCYMQRNIQVLPIAVNITSSHFESSALLDYIFQLSKQFEVPLNLIELEVTEGTLLNMNSQVNHNLSMLRQRGVKIYIDDFGTGYSSLSYIRKLTVDAIKIDKSFIDDLMTDVGRQITASVIAIADAVGLAVIAEGVETEEQLEVLKKLGCNTAQGYLFSKPKHMRTVLT